MGMTKLDEIRALGPVGMARRFGLGKPVKEIKQALDSNKSNSESNTFDKAAYQREYMRKKRAKKPS